MEPQEVDRAIQFLLAQQAQFGADLQQSRELSDQRHEEVTRALLGLTSIVGTLAVAGQRIDLRIEAIARKHEELADAHKVTQTNLNALMLVVEKYLRERTNGGSPH
jgi:hypothetical protein